MARIILSIAGPWEIEPPLKTRLDCAFEGYSPDFVEEFAFVGRRAEVVDQRDLDGVRSHRGLLTASCEFEGPGDRRWAIRAAGLLLDVFEAGALGAYVETAIKVFGPGALRGLDPEDPVALFHLFVEVLGDEEEFSTEGMQAFDLPEVAVVYGAQDAGSAQAAAFGLAARMVCDGEQPAAGDTYRATESAPLYRISHRGEAPEDDLYQNPRGAWVLTLDR